jgi:hypothetical protein
VTASGFDFKVGIHTGCANTRKLITKRFPDLFAAIHAATRPAANGDARLVWIVRGGKLCAPGVQFSRCPDFVTLSRLAAKGLYLAA